MKTNRLTSIVALVALLFLAGSNIASARRAFTVAAPAPTQPPPPAPIVSPN